MEIRSTVDIVYTKVCLNKIASLGGTPSLIRQRMDAFLHSGAIRLPSVCLAVCSSWAALGILSSAQAPAVKSAGDRTASVQQAMNLAAKGRCREALPRLKSATARLSDKQLKYRAGMASARCAMSLNQTEAAVEALLLLRREFPVFFYGLNLNPRFSVARIRS